MEPAGASFTGVNPPSRSFLKAVEDATKIQIASDEAKLRLYALYARTPGISGGCKGGGRQAAFMRF